MYFNVLLQWADVAGKDSKMNWIITIVNINNFSLNSDNINWFRFFLICFLFPCLDCSYTVVHSSIHYHVHHSSYSKYFSFLNYRIFWGKRAKRRNTSESTGQEYLETTFILTRGSKHNAENKQRLYWQTNLPLIIAEGVAYLVIPASQWGKLHVMGRRRTVPNSCLWIQRSLP
jgi:hypothetical protein